MTSVPAIRRQIGRFLAELRGLRTQSFTNSDPQQFAIARPRAAKYRADVLSFPPATYIVYGLDTYHGLALATGRVMLRPLYCYCLHRCCCCKPTSHCNKSRDPVDLPEKLRFRRNPCPALQRLTN